MISLQIQAHNAILRRHGEGFKTSPAPNQSDRVRIIMATRQIRPIRVEGNVAYVPLTRGYEAVIDAADVPLVEGKNWHAFVKRRNDGTTLAVYAARSSPRAGGKQNTIFMHRILLSADSEETDHRDGDGLNNRRANLRPATKSQNMHNQRLASNNKSGFKGAYWHSFARKWASQIRLANQNHHLGLFGCITAAAVAYARASRNLHGQFGRTR